MKKILSILLLFVVLFYGGGIYLVYQLGESIAESRAKEKMNILNSPEDLVRIKYTRETMNDLTWHKPAKEFRYNNQMYDILATEYDLDGSLIYVCYADEEETSFLERFEKILSRCVKGNKGEQNKNVIGKMLSMLFVIPDNELRIYISAFDHSRVLITPELSEGSMLPATPPPDSLK